MDHKLNLIAIILFFTLTGCAVSDDPREGGLLGYWHGTSSGRYEQRRQQKLEQLEEQEKLRQQLSEQAEKYKAEFALHDQKLAKEQDRVLQLEKELSMLGAGLGKLQVKNDKQQQQVAVLQAEIEKTKARIENQKTALIDLDSKGGSASDPDKVTILEHERDRLADEYRKLNVYYQALSNTIY
jgi:chromosome segregation ATPase